MKRGLLILSAFGYVMFLTAGIDTGLGVYRTPAYCLAAVACAVMGAPCVAKRHRLFALFAGIVAMACSLYGYHQNIQWREKLDRMSMLLPPAPYQYAKEIAGLCPSGWQTSASNGIISLQRDTPVLIMGKVSNPPRMPNESLEHYFQKAGSLIHYEVRLRFVSLLSRPEFEQLKVAREQAAAKFKRGASGKDENTKWQREYEECQVPAFFTKDYSIYVERWADRGAIAGHRIEPCFTEIYPTEVASEIESIVSSLGKVFDSYEISGSDLSK